MKIFRHKRGRISETPIQIFIFPETPNEKFKSVRLWFFKATTGPGQ